MLLFFVLISQRWYVSPNNLSLGDRISAQIIPHEFPSIILLLIWFPLYLTFDIALPQQTICNTSILSLIHFLRVKIIICIISIICTYSWCCIRVITKSDLDHMPSYMPYRVQCLSMRWIKRIVGVLALGMWVWDSRVLLVDEIGLVPWFLTVWMAGCICWIWMVKC